MTQQVKKASSRNQKHSQACSYQQASENGPPPNQPRSHLFSAEDHEQVLLQMQKLQRHANTVIGPSSNAPI